MSLPWRRDCTLFGQLSLDGIPGSSYYPNRIRLNRQREGRILMQWRRVIFVGFLAGLLTLTTLLAGAPGPTGSITVGDFAALVAAKLVAEDNQGTPSPALAAEILKKHGVKLNSDLT